MAFVAPVSTLPAVKAALVTAIAARTEITADPLPILVCYGVPGTYQPNDIIAVLDFTQAFEVMAMVGSGASKWLDENYALTVNVDCFLGGDLAQTVEERALYLASVVVDVIRTDPSIGGRVIEARPLAMTTAGAWEDERKGRRGIVTLTFQIITQL